MNIPETFNYIQEIIIRYKENKKVWEMNIKHIYSFILDLNKTISKTEYDNPIINWNSIWKQIYMIKNSTEKTIIFRYICGILPLADYLVKHKVLRQMPPCTM